MDTSAVAPHILLVDETPEIRKLLAGALCCAGFRVAAEASIQDIDVVQRLAPDVIVHELIFQREVSGAKSFLRTVREDPVLAKTPIILATVAQEAVANAVLAEELCSLDVVVLLKPFRLHSLIDAATTAWTTAKTQASSA
jgi:CheY-like chemotaxis protein